MANKREFEVLILGGGPAGIAAQLWCEDLGITSLLLEREPELGGQLLRTYAPIGNYPGVSAANGIELRDLFVRRLKHPSHTTAAIVTADLTRKMIVLEDGTEYSGRGIIIATGVRRRELGIPGEREFIGRGILESGAKQQREVAGKAVMIVGGGDAALENALILAERAALVRIIHRRDKLAARAEFVDRAVAHPKIEILTNTRATSIRGGEQLEAVEIEDIASGVRRSVEADNMLIRIGVVPNTELFRGQVELDARGYVVVDRNCATSLAGVFGAGDVASPSAPTIAAAVGQASIAVKNISLELNSASS